MRTVLLLFIRKTHHSQMDCMILRIMWKYMVSFFFISNGKFSHKYSYINYNSKDRI